MSDDVLISFPGSTIADANKLAGSLTLAIRDSDRNISVDRRRSNLESLDGGATLAIILGSAAATSVARGIAAWVARHAGTTIRIHSKDGLWVDVKNASGQDTAQIVQAALGKK